MYMDYSRLWKQLAERNMSKADLMAVTGLSSRIVAKLSKNETVTTDTLARICDALRCDVGDIMTCSSESNMSFYSRYRKFASPDDFNEYVNVSALDVADKKYVVYMTKKAAGKNVQIRCEKDETIYWEEYHMMGGMGTPSIEKKVLFKPRINRGETAIVVIKGKPAIITGLDEGIFLSAKNQSGDTSKKVTVMSEAVFKLFEAKKD